MGHKRKRSTEDAAAPAVSRLTAPATSLDPSLSSLFASSSGPVLDNPVQYPTTTRRRSSIGSQADEERSPDPETSFSESDSQSSSRVSQDARPDITSTAQRRRRRAGETDDLETRYFNRLAQETASESVPNQAHLDADHAAIIYNTNSEDNDNRGKTLPPPIGVPLHESLTKSTDASDLDNSNRTVFLGNVSSQAITSKSARKTLLKHLSTFLPALSSSNVPHKVESIRFRSVAFTAGIPKKAAYAKKEILDMTTKSTNAYVVYSSQIAAKAAIRRLNGSLVLDRHLRADFVSQPAMIDHNRCVFVGNLSFVDEETTDNTAQDENGESVKQTRKKAREPADAEEGLWRTFGKCGTVESVRVIRDKSTRVGKGFAYVQFDDMNAVEAALLYNDKKFPPLLPRKLRVMRAKKLRDKTKPEKQKKFQTTKSGQRQKSFRGTLSKLADQASVFTKDKPRGTLRRPESFVFEGHRASQTKDRVSGRARKRKPEPGSRKARRTAAFKAAGGKPKGKGKD